MLLYKYIPIIPTMPNKLNIILKESIEEFKKVNDVVVISVDKYIINMFLVEVILGLVIIFIMNIITKSINPYFI